MAFIQTHARIRACTHARICACTHAGTNARTTLAHTLPTGREVHDFDFRRATTSLSVKSRCTQPVATCGTHPSSAPSCIAHRRVWHRAWANGGMGRRGHRPTGACSFGYIYSEATLCLRPAAMAHSQAWLSASCCCWRQPPPAPLASLLRCQAAPSVSAFEPLLAAASSPFPVGSCWQLAGRGWPMRGLRIGAAHRGWVSR